MLLCLGFFDLLHFNQTLAYLKFLRGVGKIALAHDVVAVKDGARFMTADFHADNFWHASTYQVAHGRAAQIVKEQAFALRSLCDRFPRPAKIRNGYALARLLCAKKKKPGSIGGRQFKRQECNWEREKPRRFFFGEGLSRAKRLGPPLSVNRSASATAQRAKTQ